MKTLRLLLTLAVVALLCGCGTLFTTVVTVTEVETAAMNEWARAHNDHRTTEDLDRKVMRAHDAFNQAKTDAGLLLEAYKASGDKTQLEQALAVVRAAIGPVLDLIETFNPTRAATLKSSAASATKP